MQESRKQPSSPSPRGRAHILVVDDEVFIRDTLKIFLESNEFRVSTAGGGDQALEIFQRDPVEVVILDLVMPGTHGLELLRTFKELDRSVEVIIATGCGSVNTAIEALTLGAFDYITKPIVDLEHDLLRIVRDAARSKDRVLDAVKEGGTVDWKVTYERLNELVELARRGERDVDSLLESVWDLLRDGFRADGAILIDGQSAGWRTWGCATGLGSGEQGTVWNEALVERVEMALDSRAVVVMVPLDPSRPGPYLLLHRRGVSLPVDAPLGLLEVVLERICRSPRAAEGHGVELAVAEGP